MEEDPPSFVVGFVMRDGAAAGIEKREAVYIVVAGVVPFYPVAGGTI